MAWSKKAQLVLAGSLIAAALGCTPRGYVKDPGPWVEAADWSQARRVRVVLREHQFEPQVLTFVEGTAYVLEIVNNGQEAHNFVAAQFFRAVAARAARVPGSADIELTRVRALEVQPGKTVEVSFVAVRPGTYDLVCTAPGHAQAGMSGAAQILPRTQAAAGKAL